MTLRIIVGHVLDKLAELPSESIHCVVTSPPYYGLRDYGIEQQVWPDGWRGSLGLEPTLDLYLDHMVAVFRAVRRVLRKDAVCFLNIGDSYASGGSGWRPGNPAKNHGNSNRDGVSAPGFKPKDLMLIPSRLAIRLQEDGWWVRSDIAWCKRAPMPESCRDRPTSAWEHVFLLTKSGAPTYWMHRDHEGSRTKPAPDYRWVDHDNDDAETDVEPADWRTEPAARRPSKRWSRLNLWQAHDYFYDQEAVKEEAEQSSGGWQTRARLGLDTRSSSALRNPDRSQPGKDGGACWGSNRAAATRNQRNFWLLGPEPFPEAHFAVYPTEIPRRAILAGTSERGVCPKCGAPWERVTKRETDNRIPYATVGVGKKASLTITGGVSPRKVLREDGRGGDLATVQSQTIGWHQTCECGCDAVVPATVLDCFGGAGTTGLVADQLQRNAILIELNPDYARMAERRIRGDASLLTRVAAE